MSSVASVIIITICLPVLFYWCGVLERLVAENRSGDMNFHQLLLFLNL
jgi:hypothetical protein